MPHRPHSNGNGHGMGQRPRAYEPPNSHSTGEKPHSFKIDRGFNADVLRKKIHRVLVETEPGKWQILGDTSSTPIELLKLEVARDQAIGLQKHNVMIVDETNTAVAAFHNYVPKPQLSGDPISEENAAIRDKWILAMIRWLLPHELQDAVDDPVSRAKIKSHLDHCGVDIAMRPDGCAVIVFRERKELASWCCA
jgi:hypothetical protein